jgi:hypothetical protein
MTVRFKNWYAPFWGVLAFVLAVVCFLFFGTLTTANPTKVLFGIGLTQVILGVGTMLIGNHLNRRYSGDYDSAPTLQISVGGLLAIMGAVEFAGLFDAGSQIGILPMFIGEAVLVPLATALVLIGPSLSWNEYRSPV